MREKDPSWRRPLSQAVDEWDGDFVALYPDGTTSQFSLGGHSIRPGGQLGDTHWVLDHWEETARAEANGRRSLVGVMRRADADKGTDTIEAVRLAFAERNYMFGIDDHSAEGAGYHSWFAPHNLGQTTVGSPAWGATALAAALSAWDEYRATDAGKGAPPIE